MVGGVKAHMRLMHEVFLIVGVGYCKATAYIASHSLTNLFLAADAQQRTFAWTDMLQIAHISSCCFTSG
jgi:hypothetical protein